MISNPGVSSGAWIKLGETTLGGATATISFLAIPSGYTRLQVYILGRANTSDADIYLNFNSDTTAAHYANQRCSCINATYAGTAGTSAYSIMGRLKTSVSCANWCIIENTAAGVQKSNTFGGGVSGESSIWGSNVWTNTTDEISRIDITLSGPVNIEAGTRATLYGAV